MKILSVPISMFKKIIDSPITLVSFLLYKLLPFYRPLPKIAQRLISILLIVSILSSSLYSFLFLFPNKTQAAWPALPKSQHEASTNRSQSRMLRLGGFDESWGYRQRVDVTNSGKESLYD